LNEQYFRNDPCSLQEVSCTDMKCIWNQRKDAAKEMYEAKPIQTFCCVESIEAEKQEYQNIINENPELLDEFEQLLFDANETSTYGRY